MPNENRLYKTKLVARTIVGLGTGRIAYAVIRNNLKEDSANDRKIDPITVPAASFVVGGMAATAAEQYTDRMIDEIAEFVDSIRHPIKARKSKQ